MIGRQKRRSGRGDGKWQTEAAIASYRQRRNERRRAAKASRKRNR